MPSHALTRSVVQLGALARSIVWLGALAHPRLNAFIRLRSNDFARLVIWLDALAQMSSHNFPRMVIQTNTLKCPRLLDCSARCPHTPLLEFLRTTCGFVFCVCPSSVLWPKSPAALCQILVLSKLAPLELA